MPRSFFYKLFILLAFWFGAATPLAQAEDGYEMWLRYPPVAEQKLLKSYQKQLTQIVAEGESPTLAAAKAELQRGLSGLLAKPIALSDGKLSKHALVIGTPANSP